jgi:predicted ATPase
VVDRPVPDAWPFTLPPIRQLAERGIRFATPVTFLVGENGTGKSTLVEAIAEAYGIDVRGGHGARRYASHLARSPLGASLRLDMGPGGHGMRGSRNAKGFFLRAETAMGVFEYMSGHPGYGDRDLREVSHGEGFLQVVDGRFNQPGLYLMDEPESALSFTSCLRLLATMDALTEIGGQIICATHSPLLAALPGATIWELGEFGIRISSWEDLQLVDHWRRFMARPDAYLRHIAGR